jgi:predicted house-cleaning noncanonical NTP pyrophosphatase (MazG superfamily)
MRARGGEWRMPEIIEDASRRKSYSQPNRRIPEIIANCGKLSDIVIISFSSHKRPTQPLQPL